MFLTPSWGPGSVLLALCTQGQERFPAVPERLAVGRSEPHSPAPAQKPAPARTGRAGGALSPTWPCPVAGMNKSVIMTNPRAGWTL